MTLSMPWWNRCSAAADIVVVADTFLRGNAADTPSTEHGMSTIGNSQSGQTWGRTGQHPWMWLWRWLWPSYYPTVGDSCPSAAPAGRDPVPYHWHGGGQKTLATHGRLEASHPETVSTDGPVWEEVVGVTAGQSRSSYPHPCRVVDLGEVTDSPTPAGGGVETKDSVTKGPQGAPVTSPVLKGQPSWENCLMKIAQD
jgi:hypothetical protein